MKKVKKRYTMEWMLYDQSKEATVYQLTEIAKKEFEDMVDFKIDIIHSHVIRFAGRTTILNIIYEIAKKNN